MNRLIREIGTAPDSYYVPLTNSLYSKFFIDNNWRFHTIEQKSIFIIQNISSKPSFVDKVPKTLVALPLWMAIETFVLK